ncbi:MAG: ribosomal protein S18-alanine N-acetyltransferase [Solirubrobacteraceae bacterium]
MTTRRFTIRTLYYSDLPQVMAIERRCFPTPWSLAMFLLERSRPSGICLAGTEGQTLTGYLICARYNETWHLMNLAVDPPVRRRGLAHELLEEMLERGHTDALYMLEVRTSNRDAIALYERFGFRPAGTRPGYYLDTGEDAMIMLRPARTHTSTGAPG